MPTLIWQKKSCFGGVGGGQVFVGLILEEGKQAFCSGAVQLRSN